MSMYIGNSRNDIVLNQIHRFYTMFRKNGASWISLGDLLGFSHECPVATPQVLFRFTPKWSLLHPRGSRYSLPLREGDETGDDTTKKVDHQKGAILKRRKTAWEISRIALGSGATAKCTWHTMNSSSTWNSEEAAMVHIRKPLAVRWIQWCFNHVFLCFPTGMGWTWLNQNEPLVPRHRPQQPLPTGVLIPCVGAPTSSGPQWIHCHRFSHADFWELWLFYDALWLFDACLMFFIESAGSFLMILKLMVYLCLSLTHLVYSQKTHFPQGQRAHLQSGQVVHHGASLKASDVGGGHRWILRTKCYDQKKQKTHPLNNRWDKYHDKFHWISLF